MAPTDLIAISVATMMIVGMVLYLTPVIRKSREKAPVLATWIMFAIATSLSLWMYLESESHSWATNIGNVVDPLTCWSAVIVLSWISWKRWRRIVLDFDHIQVACLMATGVIVGYWFWTEDAVRANLAIQTIIVVGYVPTVNRLRLARHNTEPTAAWICQLLASSTSIIPAYTAGNLLGMVYAIRATTCLVVLFFFILRAEMRGRRSRN